MENQTLYLGIDVGSTTVKTVILDETKKKMLYSRYKRHHAEQQGCVMQLLEEIDRLYPNQKFKIAVCGSGGKVIAEKMKTHYVQEVVANAAAVRKLYPSVRCAIELGGQDAKIIFFYYDEAEKQLSASDMRMNGSCAGGTGAFIDEVASLLKVPTEDFEKLAASGKQEYSISGRCGVFAKTDIQSLLNGGAKREDIALSAFHAIVKQTIGGLAQGLELTAPIIFEGGPLTFNPTLIRVFAERLHLSKKDLIIPEHPETLVAYGAALAIDELFKEEADQKIYTLKEAAELLANAPEVVSTEAAGLKLYFNNKEEETLWRKRHAVAQNAAAQPDENGVLNIYIGIDAGSTTSKLVFLDEEERVVDSFYASNHGDPLNVLKEGLLNLYEKYTAKNIRLNVLGLGTTGYGEMMCAQGFGADYHTVETVAHAAAARKEVPDVSFVLDIGGQDMKAIWIDEGIVTNITLNEACSSGCGSFLENFAASLKIPVEEIADAAFSADHPASLGSRCTVFMNSTIITEQKNGRSPQDIMAGLCRSIIENVFTKVIRISSVEALGQKIVAQGGTFRNDAVLRALEQYLGKEVQRAPYPKEMGCIGAALLTKRKIEASGYGEKNASSFIGFESLKNFSYTQKSNILCPHCPNHCNRSMILFSNGAAYITGNRCERGATLENAPAKPVTSAPDLYLMREGLLFKNYEYTLVKEAQNIVIGMPRTLEFWDSMPFWTTFFHALGFKTVISAPSSRAAFEKGIPFVSSDTVCFPAKLVHGHIQDLVAKKVDRIFMPMMMELPSERKERNSNYVCAVVKGYPLLVHHSENPQKRWNMPFDTPMFHWHSEQDKRRQLCSYMEETFAIEAEAVLKAIDQGERALDEFHTQLQNTAQQIIKNTQEKGGYAIVLAGRPYHNDPLVSHDLSRLLTKEGIPVLTADSLYGLNDASLRYTRAEVTNNFHARMLASAMIAAETPCLEYVQIVSFGCGHDAILSDEITRIMQEVSGKKPLILKLDEGDAANSLNIRVKSFLETVSERRERQTDKQASLPDAYPAKFYKKDRAIKTVLIPNVSEAFCRILSAVLEKQGLRTEPLAVGGIKEIQLGKKYVHNDTCFPAQMCIGEALSALLSGKYKAEEVAIGMAKYQGDCRLSHYSALLRRALDSAGFNNVPIVSTDPEDYKNMHPGIRMGMIFNLQTLWGISMMDILEELRRKIRPYETIPGQIDQVFDECIDQIAAALKQSVAAAISAFRKAINAFKEVGYDRSVLKPRVFVTGEYLVTYHPGSNFHIESYLEENGMEVILPRMANVFHKDYLSRLSEMDDFKVHYPLAENVSTRIGDKLFGTISNVLENIAEAHPLFEHSAPLYQVAEENRSTMDPTFISGEGWLISAEIREYAKKGVHSFVILQPFGCLPNHICGRGIMKNVKEDFPAIQILPLDLEPDTSFANIENRLQMMIMNEKSRQLLHENTQSDKIAAESHSKHSNLRVKPA